MAPTIFFILLASLFIHANTHFQSNEEGSISVLISQQGLNFVKNLLVEEAISTLTPLELPQIQKSVNIPLVGNVNVTLSNTTIYRVDISKSVVQAGDLGITIVASGATANLSMNWSYYYKSWLIEVWDEGSASVQVEGMGVGLTLGLENHEGTLKLPLLQCGCNVKNISINLDGGASWLYQGFVDTFKEQIRSAVEKAITKKMEEGISKLDSLLRTLPKEIAVDDVAALNVTFVNDPLLTDSTIELDINGLFTAADRVVAPKHFKNSRPLIHCSQSNMLGISLDEAVFNSLLAMYFNANRLQWIVDEVPDQALLNTAAWKHIIPKLYKKYPNTDMILNISLSSPPLVQISYPDYIDASIYADMIIDVLDANETIPVACISLVISASGAFKVEGNNLGGSVTLDDFSLFLKWSDVGDFHMFLVQSVVRTFLKTIALPYVNLRLRQGFPLPILHGFTLENTDVRCTNPRLVICSDVVFAGSYDLKHLPSQGY